MRWVGSTVAGIAWGMMRGENRLRCGGGSKRGGGVI